MRSRDDDESKTSMENNHNSLKNKYEKLEVNKKLQSKNEILRNIECNFKPLFKYVKSKSKIHKNVSTVKKISDRWINKNTNWNSGCTSKIFFSLFILWKSLTYDKKVVMETAQKIIDELIHLVNCLKNVENMKWFRIIFKTEIVILRYKKKGLIHFKISFRSVFLTYFL